MRVHLITTGDKMVLLIAICFSPLGVLVLQKGLGTRALQFRKYPSWHSIAGAFLERVSIFFSVKNQKVIILSFVSQLLNFVFVRQK